jgi:hypothetical protein
VTKSRYLVLLPVGGLIAVGLAIVTFLWPDPRSSFEAILIGLFFGVLFGHSTIAAAWNALGPAPLVVRLPLSLSWIALLFAALYFNFSLQQAPAEAYDFLVLVGMCLFGQWSLVQLPLWGLPLFYGLRMIHRSETEASSSHRARQFGIRQLMIVTAIVAVLFGIGRALLLGVRFDNDRHGILIGSFLGVAAIVMTLPLLIAALLPRWAVPAVIAIAVLIAAATFLELSLFRHFVQHGDGPTAADLAAINGFTAAWVLAFVVAVRLSGYRLLAR